MELDFLEDVCPALERVADSLGVMPDFHDELQRQVTHDLANELRRVARLMDRAAGWGRK